VTQEASVRHLDRGFALGLHTNEHPHVLLISLST